MGLAPADLDGALHQHHVDLGRDGTISGDATARFLADGAHALTSRESTSLQMLGEAVPAVAALTRGFAIWHDRVVDQHQANTALIIVGRLFLDEGGKYNENSCVMVHQVSSGEIYYVVFETNACSSGVSSFSSVQFPPNFLAKSAIGSGASEGEDIREEK